MKATIAVQGLMLGGLLCSLLFTGCHDTASAPPSDISIPQAPTASNSEAPVMLSPATLRSTPANVTPGHAPLSSTNRHSSDLAELKGGGATNTATSLPPSKSNPAIAALPPPPPKVIYRPSDVRPVHDDEALAELGIRRFDSRRLRLYTDIDAAKAEVLPPMVDQLFDALESYFGALPPDRQGDDYQMTGYLIRDLPLFRETKLVPDDLPTFEHGRHRANEFWLRDQEFDYYRAHLLLHEAVHSYMTCMPRSEVTVWYMEGMAENFGTHRTGPDGRLEFGIMPSAPEEVPGWGRITLVRQAFAADDMRTIPELFDLIPDDYFRPLPYAWSWAFCTFLRTHPRYSERFQQLAREGRNPEFVRRFRELYDADAADMATEWHLFVVNLQYGYDIVRSAIDFQAGESLTRLRPSVTSAIAAQRGWQSSTVELIAGESYRVTATGQVELAPLPKPWVSEPQGISIDYFDGQPIGCLLGCIRSSEPSAGHSMHNVLPIGREKTFVAPITGTLYLRINDGWNQLVDNRGQYAVAVSRAN